MTEQRKAARIALTSHPARWIEYARMPQPTPEPEVLCHFCDDPAEWVATVDGGDRIGDSGFAEATAYERPLCGEHKDDGYDKPRQMTPADRRRFS